MKAQCPHSDGEPCEACKLLREDELDKTARDFTGDTHPDFEPWETVRYVPGHVERGDDGKPVNRSHADIEIGIVYRSEPHRVFVRFPNSDTPIACNPKALLKGR